MVTSIATLTIPVEYAELPAIDLPEKKFALTFRNKRRPLRYAWSATLLINPALSNSPVQGLQLGFNVEKPLGTKWYLGASPSFHMRVNERGYSKFGSHTSFGFAAREETYGLQANSLQFLRTPIYIARSYGKHHLDLGVAIDLLLGARGVLREVTIQDKDVEVVESLESGWISTADMQSLTTELFVGYKFQVQPNLKTGITFFYNPGRLYPGLPNSQGQIFHKWYMGLQAIYYVK